MNKWIRWQGLIGFLIFTGLLAVITLVFLDTWIKLAAQKGLEQATGAEVNISSVSHSFSPFGVTLNDVQMTDPKQPSHNQAQAKKISAQIDIMPLFLNKVIMDELVVTGVAFSQPRAYEGEVYREPTGESSADESPFDPQNIPSVDDILANSPLLTTRAIEDAQASYDKHAPKLKQQFDDLPSKEQLASYKDRIKALTETDYKNPAELAKAKTEFDNLKQALQADKQKFDDFKTAAEQAKQDLSPKLATLKAAPGKDYEQLQGVIAGDQGAIENVTRMVLGDKASVWSNYLLSAMEIVGPLLQSSPEEQEISRQKGQFIAFSEEANLPDIWIKKADISLAWQQEDILSTWRNITHQHDRIDMPTTFKIDSAASALWQYLKVDGKFRIDDQIFTADQQWDLQGIALQNVPLMDEQKFSSTITQGLLGSTGSLAVNDNALDGNGTIDIGQLAMQATGSDNLTQIIADALQGLTSLKINTQLAGTYDAPDVSFSSDLDKRLGQAALANLTGDQQSKLNELKQKLNEKAQDALGTNNTQLTELVDWQAFAEGGSGNIEEMLKSQLDSVIDKEKDKLKDKLKNKLTDKLFGNE